MKEQVVLTILMAVTATTITMCSCSDTIFNDIRNAMRAVTNDSQLLDHLIPEMYGATVRSTANPTFVFKVPSQRGANDSYEMLTMHRSDFAEPIFPNITKIRKTIDTTKLPSTSTSPSRPPLVPLLSTEFYVKTSLIRAPQGEWQQLGLEGWTGELTRPQPWLEQSHRDPLEPNLQSSAYPHDQILLDLKSQSFNGHVQDIHVISTMEQQGHKQAELQDLMNGDNVYIARVNDPFSYSMKWTYSNASLAVNTSSKSTDQRDKRDVAKLYSMIKCSTGCDPLIYKGYGCYCGFGGHGVPVDGIDRCCRLHDKCYGQSNCISYLEYFVPYIWKCYQGKPLCAIDHGEFGGPDSCAARLCQCDLRLSRCLRKFYCPRRRAICYSSRARRLQNLIYFD